MSLAASIIINVAVGMHGRWREGREAEVDRRNAKTVLSD